MASTIPSALRPLVDEYASRIPEFHDPEQAEGQCINIEFQFRTFVRQHGGIPYHSVFVRGPLRMTPKRVEFIAYWGDSPAGMTHTALSVLCEGKWWVVDFTYSQFDETAPWPLVEPEAEYLARFRTSEFMNEGSRKTSSLMFGISVSRITPIPLKRNCYTATVDAGAPLVYRNVGNIKELDYARYAQQWSGASGGFTVRDMEGDTQFASTFAQAKDWSHPMRNESGLPVVVEADISGLRVAFIHSDGTAVGGSPNLVRNPTPDNLFPSKGVFYPSTTLGIGVIGNMPVTRIKRLWLIEPGHDRLFHNWDEFVAWRKEEEKAAGRLLMGSRKGTAMKAQALGHRLGGIPVTAARKKVEVTRPKRLYHYTSTMHLPAILGSGYLKLTESNIQMSGAGPGVVWFTDRPDAVGIGVTPGFKDAVEIVIDTPPDAQWWPKWGREQGIEDSWYDALASAAGGSPDRWWVITREIPISDFVSVKVNGKPLNGLHMFGTEGALKTAEADTQGVMVCLVPDEAASAALMAASGSTESLEEQHITLLYLGSTEDAGGDGGRERLHRAVYDFAIHSGHDVLDGKANGWGVFNNPDEDESVLVALWDIPNIAEFRAGLKASCESHGVSMRTEDHGFTPHSTMKYLDGPTTTVPDALDPAPTSTFSHVVISWGDDWQSVALTGSLDKTADFKSEEHPRGDNEKNKGQFSRKPGNPRATWRSDQPPAPKTPVPAPAPSPAQKPDAPKDNPKPDTSKSDAPKKDAPKKSRDPAVEKKMIARGDIYGHYLPKGKYQEGDPRNDPEFEAKHDEIEKLSNGYTKPDYIKGKNGKRERVRDCKKYPTGGQTQDLYDNQKDYKTGAMDWYSPERHAMHRKILRDLLEKAKNVPHDGKCLIMAGPSGAGKSTFLAKYGDQLGVEGGKKPTNYIVINPDDFKELIPFDPSRYPGLDANEMASVRHEESSYLAQRAADTLMAQGVNVIMDITMSDAAKAEKKYVTGHEDKYTYTVALVDGDMKMALNNAGNRWKAPDDESGEREWSGRFVPMSLVETQAPKKKGYRSINAEAYVTFAAKPFVSRAVVYDPYAPEKGVQDAKGAIHEAARRTSVMSGMLRGRMRREAMGTYETTEITEKIKDNKQGKITDAELVTYLTEDAKYKPTDVNPYTPGTGEWFLWSESGKPYTPGSFQEVVKALDTGLLDDDVFEEVMAVFHGRMS